MLVDECVGRAGRNVGASEAVVRAGRVLQVWEQPIIAFSGGGSGGERHVCGRDADAVDGRMGRTIECTMRSMGGRGWVDGEAPPPQDRCRERHRAKRDTPPYRSVVGRVKRCESDRKGNVQQQCGTTPGRQRKQKAGVKGEQVWQKRGKWQKCGAWVSSLALWLTVHST